MTDKVSYPATEFMQGVAGQRQKQWDKLGTEGYEALQNNTLRLDSFGDLPAIKEFGRLYMATREIYLGALAAAQKDMDSIAQGIIDSAKRMEQQDTEAGAAFLALQKRWESGGTESAQTQTTDDGQMQQRQERREERRVNTSDKVGEGQGQVNAPTQAPAQPAPPTTDPDGAPRPTFSGKPLTSPGVP